eukprot:6210817-Pleurochrysis_carterae.AAC.4
MNLSPPPQFQRTCMHLCSECTLWVVRDDPPRTKNATLPATTSKGDPLEFQVMDSRLTLPRACSGWTASSDSEASGRVDSKMVDSFFLNAKDRNSPSEVDIRIKANALSWWKYRVNEADLQWELLMVRAHGASEARCPSTALIVESCNDGEQKL